MNNLKYFTGTIWFALASLVTAFWFLGGATAAVTVGILAVLELSLSFDNAVVNAKELASWDEKWKHRFLTWGMVVAVFGMRLVFPVVIVAIVAHMGPIDALTLAIKNPKEYAAALTSSHVLVAGFGMAFLTMVFLKFFFDKEKEVHWISFIEKPLAKLGRLDMFEVAVTLGAVYGFSTFLNGAEATQFMNAGIAGIIAYIAVDGLGALLGGEENEVATTVARTGLAGFIYLELLDASFSLDGVIGAFAISNNVFVIALGLGVGAFAVRGLTLMMVEKGTLEIFKYLEHGAFYAIAALAVLMGWGASHEVSEVVTGLIGAGFIGLALISSIVANKNS